MNLADLQRLAEAGPKQLRRLATLAARLKAVDEKRAAIVSELAALGVSEDMPPFKPNWGASTSGGIMPNVPRCEVCGAVAGMTVDEAWYCEEHDPTA